MVEFRKCITNFISIFLSIRSFSCYHNNRILNGLKTNIFFSLLSVKNWELGRESINFAHDFSIMACHETLVFAISHLLFLIKLISISTAHLYIYLRILKTQHPN